MYRIITGLLINLLFHLLFCKQGNLTYDPMRMQWSLKTRAYTVPPTGGLVRNFHCVDISNDRVFVYVGTSSGEVMVYRRDTVVFRACIPVSFAVFQSF